MGVDASKMETRMSKMRTWKAHIGSRVSPKHLEKGDCYNGEREQGRSVQCGDTVKGKHVVDMDTLVDIEMSTKEPGHARGSMSSEELTICRTRHTETATTKVK